MKILILGAAGEIGRMLARDLIKQTDNELVLYARNASKRLQNNDPERISLFDGDFTDYENVVKAMQGIDAVYLNDMNSKIGVETIVKAMKDTGVKRIIVASILGIYGEVPGAFGNWNRSMVGDRGIKNHKKTAVLIEDSGLDYTILRLTWLYNQEGNRAYHLTFKGEPFEGAQVTRQAVSQLIVDILTTEGADYIKTNIGVGEPNTNWDKPSFY